MPEGDNAVPTSNDDQAAAAAAGAAQGDYFNAALQEKRDRVVWCGRFQPPQTLFFLLSSMHSITLRSSQLICDALTLTKKCTYCCSEPLARERKGGGKATLRTSFSPRSV